MIFRLKLILHHCCICIGATVHAPLARAQPTNDEFQAISGARFRASTSNAQASWQYVLHAVSKSSTPHITQNVGLVA